MLHLHRCELNFSVPCQLPESLIPLFAQWSEIGGKIMRRKKGSSFISSLSCRKRLVITFLNAWHRRFGLAFIDFLVYPLNFLNGVLNEGAFGNV